MTFARCPGATDVFPSGIRQLEPAIPSVLRLRFFVDGNHFVVVLVVAVCEGINQSVFKLFEEQQQLVDIGSLLCQWLTAPNKDNKPNYASVTMAIAAATKQQRPVTTTRCLDINHMFDETIATMLLLPLPCRWTGRPVLLLRLLRQNLETMSVTKQVVSLLL